MATTMNVQRTAVTSSRVAGAKDVPLRHFAAAGSTQAPVCSSVSIRAHGLGHTPVRQTQIRQLGQLQRSSATEYIGNVVAQPEWKFAVVVARFNSLVTKELLEGAIEVFNRHGVPAANVDVAWVPGSFELPVVAKAMAASGSYQAVVTIGAIIKGATSHYDAVVAAATSGVLSAGSSTGVPVVFGVLTTEDLEQALDRAGGKVGNKGGEAAETAIEMASLMAQLRGLGKAAPAKLE